ncbi:hypothetical protein AQZ50_18260 [Novosphingobium sp. Fuku2-ISO-50]|nr:hypothetical protein AQZ50_18260 [Novosphingobium sp. Fuku2-ISO-50]
MFGAGVIYFGSAYWSAAGFESAAKDGDADKISNMADMASIKGGLKSQVSAALAKKGASSGSSSGNAMSGLATFFVSAVADKMIDAFVTPDGLAAIITGARPGGHADGKIKNDGTLTQSSSDFLDIDHFRVKVSKQGGGTTSLVFERRGIITWKLVRIALPTDLLEDKPSPATTPVAAQPQAQGLLLSLPAEQTHPVKNGEDWAQVIPASTEPADAQDCDRPVLEKQTASLDGGYVYQQVCHWATSSDIIQVRLLDGKRKEVTPGNSLAVIRNGPYRGYLLVQKHKYNPGPEMGSYDSTWIIKPDGTEILEVPGTRDGEDAPVQAWLQAKGWVAN